MNVLNIRIFASTDRVHSESHQCLIDHLQDSLKIRFDFNVQFLASFVDADDLVDGFQGDERLTFEINNQCDGVYDADCDEGPEKDRNYEMKLNLQSRMQKLTNDR